MATSYSSRFYTSAGVVKGGFPYGTKGFPTIQEFNETIATTVTDAADEHYMMPLPAVGERVLEGFWLGNGQMDTNVVPTLDADIVLRKTLDGTTTDVVLYDSSASGLFSAPGGVSAVELQASSPAKIGATAGWAAVGATNLAEATLPASQTASTLVVPIRGLKVGDIITGFKVSAQIESAGGAVTLDADLRKLTNAAGDPTDASVGAITQVAVTADTAVAASKTGLSDTVAADEWFYVLITGTTAASTDIRFLGVTVTILNAVGSTTYLRWIGLRRTIPAADEGVAHLVFKVNTQAATPAAANLTCIPIWY